MPSVTKLWRRWRAASRTREIAWWLRQVQARNVYDDTQGHTYLREPRGTRSPARRPMDRLYAHTPPLVNLGEWTEVAGGKRRYWHLTPDGEQFLRDATPRGGAL